MPDIIPHGRITHAAGRDVLERVYDQFLSGFWTAWRGRISEAEEWECREVLATCLRQCPAVPKEVSPGTISVDASE